ncbi:non-specific lipid transfer protein GPI-anchored 13-like [Andrographis paniculata]|uniref:non-specific lipid transfer protein GPI-anchored 13-like n=1 Tax=Andrographis paniculata TaxID=175694 RepID=UPI0021E93BBD|nr:non-specific lipid transfer protein GPI-anchored 13-like [Andrographis paniculata]
MSSSSSSSLFLLFSLTLLTVAAAAMSSSSSECQQPLLELSPCLPYAGGASETAESPTPECCSGLKQVLKTSQKCLCSLIIDPDLAVAINVTRAFALPTLCNSPANISQCPSLLHLAPGSAEAQIYESANNNSNNNTYSNSSGSPISINAYPNSESTTAVTGTVVEFNAAARGDWRPGLQLQIINCVALPYLLLYCLS